METYSCSKCGREFQRFPSEVRTDAPVCSRACFGGKRREVRCARCGRPFLRYPSAVGERSYCSRECYFAECRRTVDLECSQCGAAFQRSPGAIRSDRVFCSEGCYRASRAGDSGGTSVAT